MQWYTVIMAQTMELMLEAIYQMSYKLKKPHNFQNFTENCFSAERWSQFKSQGHRCTALQCCMDKIKFQAPILRLLSKIIVFIFTLSECGTGNEYYLWAHWSRTVPFALIVSLVCIIWQHIMLTNSLLWVRIHIIPLWKSELIHLCHWRSYPPWNWIGWGKE